MECRGGARAGDINFGVIYPELNEIIEGRVWVQKRRGSRPKHWLTLTLKGQEQKDNQQRNQERMARVVRGNPVAGAK